MDRTEDKDWSSLWIINKKLEIFIQVVNLDLSDLYFYKCVGHLIPTVATTEGKDKGFKLTNYLLRRDNNEFWLGKKVSDVTVGLRYNHKQKVSPLLQRKTLVFVSLSFPPLLFFYSLLPIHILSSSLR